MAYSTAPVLTHLHTQFLMSNVNMNLRIWQLHSTSVHQLAPLSLWHADCLQPQKKSSSICRHQRTPEYFGHTAVLAKQICSDFSASVSSMLPPKKTQNDFSITFWLMPDTTKRPSQQHATNSRCCYKLCLLLIPFTSRSSQLMT